MILTDSRWRLLLFLTPYLHLVLCTDARSRTTDVSQGRRNPARWERPPRGYPGGTNACPRCDVRKCSRVTPEECDGQIVKDECNCCPVCDVEEDVFIRPTTSPHSNSSVCESVTCSRSQMCILNIQGLPICRCLTDFWCKRETRTRPLCSEEGREFRSRCFLKIHECVTGQKVKVAHRGGCHRSRGRYPSDGHMTMRDEAREERQQRKRRRKQEKKQQRASQRQHRQQRKRLNMLDNNSPITPSPTPPEVTHNPEMAKTRDRDIHRTIRKNGRERKKSKNRRRNGQRRPQTQNRSRSIVS